MQGLSIRQRMQETLYQTADAGDSLSDRCRRFSIRHADAGDSQSNSGCRSLSIRQRMQETLYQTADAVDSLSDADDSQSKSGGRRSIKHAGDTLSDSGYRRLSPRQRMQVSLYQIADARDSHSDIRCRSLLDSGSRRLSIRQRM